MQSLGVVIERYKNPADTFIKILALKKLKQFMRAYEEKIE